MTLIKQWSQVLRLCYFIALLLSIDLSSAKQSTCNDLENDISNTTGTLVRLLDFFIEHENQINLDGIAGLGFADGILIQAIQKLRTNLSFRNVGLLELFEILERRIDRITAVAKMNVKIKTPTYYHNFQKVLADRGLYSTKHRKLDHCPRWTAVFRKITDGYVHYDEKKGDACIVNVIGGSSNSLKRCKSTRDCWKQMVLKGYNGRRYDVTHALLYILLMRKSGCHAPPGNSFSKIIHNLCCRITAEFRLGVKRLQFLSGNDVDLLAEQATVCTIAGYTGFDNNKFYKYLVKIQSKHGCFHAEFEKPHVGRRLLNDWKMDDGCSAHESGLVSTYLSMRLRHLVVKFTKRCA